MQSPLTPIGRQLAMTAKVVARAFEQTLTEAGGSMPTWFILLSLMQQSHRAQSELAAALGIQGPTLTHHLNGMEAEGLSTRTRDPKNRRIHRVALTEVGQAKFQQMRSAAVAFDKQLRAGFRAEEIDTLRGILRRLEINVDSAGADPLPPCVES